MRTMALGPTSAGKARATTTMRGACAVKALAFIAICLAVAQVAIIAACSLLDEHNKNARELRLGHVDYFTNSSVRIAFCVPALYNIAQLNLAVLSQWVAYHEQLGVDEFFLHVMEAEQDAAIGPGPFYEWLKQRPNVQMHVVEGKEKCKGHGYDCGQGSAIARCWRHVKREKFTWALFGDIDEYYALNDEGSPSGFADLRAFLQPYSKYFGINFG